MSVKAYLAGAALIAQTCVTAASAIEIGAPAPSFAKTPIWNGGTVHAGQYVGKVVYLDFWATWCAPCRESFPALRALEKKYANQGLVVIAVNVDEPRADIARFLDWAKVDFLVLHDAGGALASRFDIKTMPTSYLIDRSGKLRYAHAGFRIKDVPSLEEKIQSLLTETGN